MWAMMHPASINEKTYSQMKLNMTDAPPLTDKMIHLVDCAVFDVPEPALDPLADIQTDRDEMILYALQLRPCYNRIGRIIGQLGGLFILAQMRGRFETDFQAVAIVIEQVGQTADAIHAVKIPAQAERHHRHLVKALGLVRSVTAEFGGSMRTPELVRQRLDDWTQKLKQASAMVNGAASERLGLLPVDFSHACCNCGVNAA
jgi:hypothetical protein